MADVDDNPPRSLSIPAAPIPRALVVALLVLVVVFAAGLPWLGGGGVVGLPEAIVSGAWIALVLWFLIAFPWVLRRALLGLRLEVEPRRLVVVPRIGLRRSIPLAPSTCVVYRRGEVPSRRSVEERWYVEVVTGASEGVVETLARDVKASSDDGLRMEVGNWDLIGAPAARCGAEWIARRLRVPLVDQSGAVPVRLPPGAVDWNYARKLRKAPALLVPASPPPAEFVIAGGGPGRSVSWKTPDTHVFWLGAACAMVAVFDWGVAMWETGSVATQPPARALGFAAVGLPTMALPLGRRSRISVDSESLSHEVSLFGLPYASDSVPVAGIEDVTWQEPHDGMMLPPARRVVVVTDKSWLWVFTRNEASARWLVGWLQQALLAE